MDDSEVICDEVNEKKPTYKMKNSYIPFLFITIALLIDVIFYCYLIKYQAIHKHLLPFHFTNNKLRIRKE